MSGKAKSSNVNKAVTVGVAGVAVAGIVGGMALGETQKTNFPGEGVGEIYENEDESIENSGVIERNKKNADAETNEKTIKTESVGQDESDFDLHSIAMKINLTINSLENNIQKI